MDWELRQSEATFGDPYGLESFLYGLDQEFRPRADDPLRGFNFLQDARQMLDFSRKIERDLLTSGGPGTLYVGFQNDQKLIAESSRYRRLRQANIVIYGFGEGTPSARSAEGLDAWYRLERNHKRIENQWFLVAQAAHSVAFVGWEVSDDTIWGLHGISYPGKNFVGFVSDDSRVVTALVGHLEDIRSSITPETPDESGDLRTVLNDLHPRRVMLLADDGKRPFLNRALTVLASKAPIQGCELFLYDLTSASSLLSSTFYKKNEKIIQPLDAQSVRDTLNRGYLADSMDRFARMGANVNAVFPTILGFGDLAKWCKELQIDVVVVPVEFDRPSLSDRLSGYRISALSSKVSCAVVVDDPQHGAWLCKPLSS